MSDLQLPPEVRPLWIEGVFTSEYERDTLPLLFASDRLFDEYYDALGLKFPHVSVALDQIRTRNNQARQQRAEGLWQDCVESLGHCVHLRRCVFEETDFQFAAAQKHHILTMVNFATFFLKESKGQDAMLMRSFELFKAAEDVAKDIQNKTDRSFLLACVHNNFATYFARRKKYKAAAQRFAIGLRVWNNLQLRRFDLYFAVQRGSGESWSNRFDESYRILRQATAFAPSKEEAEDAEGERAAAQQVEDDPNAAPVRFQIQLLSSGVALDAAANIALHHNIAVALIGLRRYKDAVPWCAEAMELVTAQSSFLKATHPIVVAVRKAQDFCERTAFTTKFMEYRMKHTEYLSDEYRRMHAALGTNKSGASPAPGSRPPTRSNLQSREREQGESSNHQVTDKAAKHPNSRLAAVTYFPRSAPRVSKPSQAEALRTYLKNFSERQLIEEFGFSGPKKPVPKPPAKRASPTNKTSPRSTSSPKNEQRPTTAQSESESPRKTNDDTHLQATSRTDRSYSSDSRSSMSSRPSSAHSAASSPARSPRSGSSTPRSGRSTPREKSEEPTSTAQDRSPTPTSSRSRSRSPSPTPEASPAKTEAASPEKKEEEPAQQKEPETPVKAEEEQAVGGDAAPPADGTPKSPSPASTPRADTNTADSPTAKTGEKYGDDTFEDATKSDVSSPANSPRAEETKETPREQPTKPEEKPEEPAKTEEKTAEEATPKPEEAKPAAANESASTPGANDKYGDDDFEAESPAASPKKEDDQPTASDSSPTKATPRDNTDTSGVNASTASADPYGDDEFEAESPAASPKKDDS